MTTARWGRSRSRPARSAAPSSRVWTPKTPGGVAAGKAWSHRERAGGDDQVVKTLSVAAAGGQVTDRDHPDLKVDGLHVGEHAQIDAVGPVRLRRSGDQLLPVGDVAGHPGGDAAGRIGAVGSALEGNHLELVACQPLGLGGRAHPGGVAADDHHPVGHAITASKPRSSSGQRGLFAGQARSRMVRISVPARTASVTRVFSAISASRARWSSPRGPQRGPHTVICPSIHRLARSLTV
jgi:hypothetical protein